VVTKNADIIEMYILQQWDQIKLTYTDMSCVTIYRLQYK